MRSSVVSFVEVKFWKKGVVNSKSPSIVEFLNENEYKIKNISEKQYYFTFHSIWTIILHQHYHIRLDKQVRQKLAA